MHLRRAELTIEGVGGPSPILTKLAPGVRFGPKPNLKPLFLPSGPIGGAPGPPKGANFDPPKNQFFGQFFSLSNRRDMFAMGFS